MRRSDRYSQTEDSQTDEHNLLHILAKNVKHETPEQIYTHPQTYAARQVPPDFPDEHLCVLNLKKKINELATLLLPFLPLGQYCNKEQWEYLAPLPRAMRWHCRLRLRLPFSVSLLWHHRCTAPPRLPSSAASSLAGANLCERVVVSFDLSAVTTLRAVERATFRLPQCFVE